MPSPVASVSSAAVSSFAAELLCWRTRASPAQALRSPGRHMLRALHGGTQYARRGDGPSVQPVSTPKRAWWACRPGRRQRRPAPRCSLAWSGWASDVFRRPSLPCRLRWRACIVLQRGETHRGWRRCVRDQPVTTSFGCKWMHHVNSDARRPLPRARRWKKGLSDRVRPVSTSPPHAPDLLRRQSFMTDTDTGLKISHAVGAARSAGPNVPSPVLASQTREASVRRHHGACVRAREATNTSKRLSPDAMFRRPVSICALPTRICANDATPTARATATARASPLPSRSITTNHCPNHPNYDVNPNLAMDEAMTYQIPAAPMYNTNQQTDLSAKGGATGRAIGRHDLLGVCGLGRSTDYASSAVALRATPSITAAATARVPRAPRITTTCRPPAWCSSSAWPPRLGTARSWRGRLTAFRSTGHTDRTASRCRPALSPAAPSAPMSTPRAA